MAKPYGTPVANCPKCHAAIGDAHPYLWCVECGEQLPPEIRAKVPQLQALHAAQSAPTPSHPAAQRETYPAVRTLARVYRGLAYITLCLGIVLCIIIAVQTNNLVAVLAVLLYSAFVFLVLPAGGELLGIIPDLADRAAQTNSLLRDIKELLSKKI
jgi:hypothetical protein